MNNGRRANGTFAKGHSGNVNGCPTHRRMAELRRAFISCVTPEEIQSVKEALLNKALGTGKDAVQAATLFLQYACGKPVQQVSFTDEDGEPLSLSLEDYLKAARKLDDDTAGNRN